MNTYYDLDIIPHNSNVRFSAVPDLGFICAVTWNRRPTNNCEKASLLTKVSTKGSHPTSKVIDF